MKIVVHCPHPAKKTAVIEFNGSNAELGRFLPTLEGHPSTEADFHGQIELTKQHGISPPGLTLKFQSKKIDNNKGLIQVVYLLSW